MKQQPSNPASISQHWQELTYLPTSDARRAGLAHSNELSQAQRQELMDQAEENDYLRMALAFSPLPSELQTRLLEIPDTAPPQSGHRQRVNDWLRQPVGWPHLAICALLIAGLVAWFTWPKPLPPALVPLDKGLSQQVAALAVAGHQSSPTLDPQSTTPQELQAALDGRNLPFKVLVPSPPAALQFLGGGTGRLGAAPAVFTRWQEGNHTATLYQFDAAQLGLPPRFAQTTAIPQQLWRDGLHYQVIIWPGAGDADAWALVLEADTSVNPFAAVCH